MQGARLQMERLEDRITPATRTWDGGGGNALWSNAANWDGPDLLPALNDDVVIPAVGASANVIFDASVAGAGITIGSLTSDKPFLLSGDTLTVTGNLQMQNSNAFTLQGGTLTGATVLAGTTITGTNSGGTLAGVTVNGTLDLGAGSASVTGDLTVGAAGVVQIGNNSGNRGTLSFRGGRNTIAASPTGATESGTTVTITTTAAHSYVVGETVVIAGVGVPGYNGTFVITSVPSATTFTYTAGAGLGASGGGTATANQSLSGSGTVIFGTHPGNTLYTGETAGTNLTIGPSITVHGQNGFIGPNQAFIGGFADGTFTNQGTISAEVAGGTFILGGVNWSNTGSTPKGIQVAAGATVQLAGSWSNTGTITAAATSTLFLTGTFATATLGTINSAGATVNVGNGSPGTGTLNNTGNTLTLNDTTGSWRLFGGTIDGGTVATTGSNALVGTSGGGLLTNNVTLNGTLDLTASGAIASVTGNLTVSATGIVKIGSNSGNRGTLSFRGGRNTIAASPAGATESGTTVTIATTAAHSFVVGESVVIAGVGVAGYNGTFVIASVPSATTFTYTAAAGLAASGGGTATVLQTLGGSGNVVFGTHPGNTLYTGETSGTNLTIGPDITVHSQNGFIGPNQTNIGGFADGTFTNQGTISADAGTLILGGVGWSNTGVSPRGIQVAAGATVQLAGSWSNTGTITAAAGSTLFLTGAFATATLGTINSAGATVNLGNGPAGSGILTNTGSTLTLNDTTGSWRLLGGTIDGGTVATTGSNVLIGTSGGLLANGVTLNGTLDLTASGALASVTGGLSLGATGLVQVGSASGNRGTLSFRGGTQTLSGSGSVVFGSHPGNTLWTGEASGTNLTIGPSITVRGQNGFIGPNTTYLGGPTDGSFTNQGTITADVPGSLFTLGGTNWTNSGTIQASGGASLFLSGASTTTNPGWTNSANHTISITGAGALTLTASGAPTPDANGTEWINAGTISASDSVSTITTATEAGTTVTITTAAAHNFAVGQTVVIAGVGVAGYNGTFTIASAPTPTTFTYTAAAGLAASGGGTATVSPTVNLGGAFTQGALGTLNRSGGTVNLQGTLNNTGDTLTLDNSKGSWVLLGGAINGGTLATTGANALIATSSGGVLNNVTLNGTLDLTRSSGHVSVTGNLTLAPGIVLQIGSSAGNFAWVSFKGGRNNIANSPGGATESGTTVTITTTTVHSYVVGETVMISGVGVAGYNGTFTITSVPSSTTFTYTAAAAGLANSGGGTATVLQTLDGSGTVVFGSHPGNSLYTGETSGTNLTIGPNITVHGQNGFIGPNGAFIGGATDGTFTNQGTISADVPGGTFTLGGANWTNAGTIGAMAGASLVLTGTSTTTNPAWTNTANHTISISGAGSLTLTATGAPTPDANGTQWINAGTISIADSVSTITTATEVGAAVTITTAAAHGFAVGQTVVIAGVGVAGYNGTFTIASVPTTTTFTYTAASGLAASGGGTATVSPTVNLGAVFTQAALGTFNRTGGTVNLQGTLNNTGDTLTLDNSKGSWVLLGGTINGGTLATTGTNALIATSSGGILGNSMTLNGTLDLTRSSARVSVTGNLTLAPGIVLPIGSNTGNLAYVSFKGGRNNIANSPNGATESGTTVTITTTTVHSYVVGETVVIAGVGVAGYNGTFTITSVPSSTTFTYTAAVGGLANSGGGTATVLQTLDGSGTVVFGSNAGNTLYTGETSGTNLTIGPNITVHGQNGFIGPNGTFIGGATDGVITNQGTISADIPGGTFTLGGANWTNAGTIQATGASLVLTGASTTTNPAWTNAANHSVSITGAGSLTLTATGAPTPDANGTEWINAGTISIADFVSTITTATEAGSTVTITTAAAHNFAVGQTVTIAGVGVAGYNGTFTIASVPTSTTFTYSTGAGLAASGGGTATGSPTANLGAVFTQAALGDFTRSGGTVNLQGTLNNTGDTLTLDNSKGSWVLLGGAIIGGTLATTGTNALIATSSGGVLSNVTLNGTLDLTRSSAHVSVTGNLTLAPGIVLQIGSNTGNLAYVSFKGGRNNIANSPNGATESGTTVTITTTTVHSYVVGQTVVISGVGVAGYNGTFTITSVPSSTTFTYTAAAAGLANSGGGTATVLQTLDGSGTVVFGSHPGNTLYTGETNGTNLTIGPNITVHGQNGFIGPNSTFIGGATDGTFTNQGTISVDVAGGLFTLGGANWTNSGTIEARNGGTILTAGTNANFAAGTLTGGTWKAFAGSTLRLTGESITTNAANIVLDGPNSNFFSDNGTTNALAGFANNAAAGAFTIQNGRNFTTPVAFTNAGNVVISIAGGAASTFTSNTGGSSTGDWAIDASGALRFTAGTYLLDNGTDITGAGFATIQGATVNVGDAAADVINAANLALPSGTLGGLGVLNITGTFNWSGGTMQGGGVTALGASSTTNFSSGALNGRILNNAGTFHFAGSSMSTSGANTITNLAGGLFDVTLDNSDLFNLGAAPTFINNAGAIVRKSAGTLNTNFTGILNNAGLVDVQSGTLTLNGGGTSTGNFNIAATDTLKITADYTLNAGAAITGAGTAQLLNNTLTIGAGAIVTADNFLMSGGTLTGPGTFRIGAGQNFTWTGGAMSGTGVTETLGDGTPTESAADGILTFSGGSLSGRSLNNAGAFHFTTASMSTTGANTITNLPGALFDITLDNSDVFNVGTAPTFTNSAGAVLQKSAGNLNTNFNGNLNNLGTVDVKSGTLTFNGAVTQIAGSTLTGGSWIVRANSTLATSGANIATNQANVTLDGANSLFPKFNSIALNDTAGSFTIQNGGTFTAVGNLSNAGSVTLGAGSTLALPAGSNYTQTGGTTTVNGSLTVAGAEDIQAGILRGSGAVTGNVANAGHVNPGTSPGILSEIGDYTQASGGALNIEIGGLTLGTQYDQFNVAGAANLNGALNVTLVGGFVPAIGDTFHILTFAARTGDFATKNGLLFANGLVLSPIYTATGLDLVVSPTHLAFVQQPSLTTAGQTISPAVTVAIEDASNNILTFDNDDIVTVAIASGPSGATLNGVVNATVVDGVATFSNLSIQKAGTFTLSADSTSAPAQGISASFTINPAAVATLTLAGFTSPSTAGVAGNFTVSAFDSFDNLATNYTGTLHFTSTDGAAVLPTDSTLTSGSGNFSATLKTAGSQSITATDIADSSITGTSTTIAVNAAAASHFAVVAPSGAAAGVEFSFTVTALDPFNNTATGYTGTVHFTSTDGQAVLPANSTLTNGAGSFSATLKTAGSQSITATDASNNSITGSSNSTTVSPAAATHFTVSAPASATAGNAFSFTVTAQDQFNNTATGYTGTIHITSTDGAAVLPGDSTLNNGVGAFNATLKIAGDRTITATDTVFSSIIGTSNTIAVSPAAATHFAVAAPTSAVPGAPLNFTVTAQDPFNNTATGYAGTIHFTSSDGAAVLPGDSTLNSGFGTFSATLNTVNNQTITATDTVAPGIAGASNNIFVNTVTHFAVSAPAGAIAGSAFSFTVTALDVNDETVTDYAGVIHFSSSDGQADLPADSTLTNGVGTFSVTLKTAGSQTITATDSTASALTGTSNTVAVSAIAATHFSVSAPSTATAGNTFSFTVTAQDPFNNTDTGYTGTVHLVSSDGQAVLPADSTLTSGVGTLSVTLKTAGSQTLTATDTSNGSINGTSGSIAVNAAAATHYTVNAPSSATAGGAFNVTVTALDQFNNTATGYTGTVHFTSSDGQAVLPGDGTLTNSVGTLSATLKTAGNQSITATDTLDSSITGASNTITVSAAAAAHFTVSAPANATAGSAFSFTVTALDPFNNTATGYTGTVHFTSSDGQAVLPGDSTLTNGVGTLSATLKTAGNQLITAADTSDSSIIGTSGTIAVSAAAATHFTVLAPSSATAGAVFNFTVTALDLFNNTATGYTGTVHFTSSDGQAVLPGDGTLTSGVGTLSATLKTAGNQTITATDTSDSSITGTSNTIAVSAAAATHFTVLAPSSATAGAVFNFTVTALDLFNNTATGYTGTVHFTSSDGQAVLPGDGTLTSGVGTLSATLKTAGNQSITAADTSDSSITGTSGTIAVSAAAATHFTVLAPSSATAGAVFNFTVTALDSFNNTATGYTGTVHFTSSDGQAVLPADGTLTNGAGTLSATLKTAGNQTITATDTSDNSITGASNTIIVSAAAATHFTLSAPANATAGTAFNFAVTALDPFDNTATGYTGAVHFTSSDGQAVLPVDGTLSNGAGMLSATLKTAGNQTITATDTSDSLITGTSNTVAVSAAAATHFTVLAPSSATAGSAFSFTVTALDPFSNTDTAYAGAVHFTSSDGQAELPGDAPLANGVGAFSATLKTAGNQTLTAADAANASITGASNTITVSAAAATHFTVSAPSIATAGAPFSFMVTALDQFDNTATSYAGTVHFTSSDGQAALPSDSLLTNGTSTVSATLKTAGNQSITATDTANSSMTDTSNTVAVSSAAATRFAVLAPSSATAGTSFNFTVTASDPFNNTATGYTGTVHFTSSDGAAALPGNTGLTSGVGTFSATLNTSGNQTITAIDSVNNSISGSSNPIAVTSTVGHIEKQYVAVGAAAGAKPRVTVFDVHGAKVASFLAFGAGFQGGVRVAVGDVNGDGAADIIVAPGAGGPQFVKVIDGTRLNQILPGGRIAPTALLGGFFAYQPTFAGGVYVAAGDVNGDGRADIVVGKGADAEGRVKVIDATKLNLRGADGHILGGALLGSFLAYPGEFNGGVTVAAGDFNKDGKADVIVAPATGAAQVKVLDATKLRQLDAVGVISSNAFLAHFVAYEPSFNGGVFVAAGDVNGDGRADIITGSGPGMAGLVNVIDAARANLRQKNGVISPTAIAQVFKSFVAGGGIGVGAVDLDNDGFFEALIPAGPAKRRLLAIDLHHSRIALDLALAFDADSFAGG